MTQDRVLWQTGDDLSAANLGLATYRQNRTNYVEQGMALSADWGDRRLYASPGIAFLRHDNRGVAVQSDNKQTSIPSSGTVTAYLVVDLDATDSVNLATGDPDPPRLAIGTVDADAESVEEINRFPRLRAREPDGEQDVVRQLELDGKADSPHDNAAHTETYAVDGDPQPPEQHGMGEHDDSVASSQALDAVDSDLQDHTDDETNPHAVTADQTGAPTAPVDTAELSEAAVTAAILAANAVESGKIAASAVGEDEIASGAVGREELMQALGTSQGSPISGTTHFEGVSTDEASIGTVSGQGDVFRLIDRQHLEESTSQIQITGLSEDKEYRIWYNSGNTSDDIHLRLNGDGDSTGNYLYWDASATKQAGQDEFLIAERSNSTNVVGTLMISGTRFGSVNRTGINNRMMVEGDLDRVSDFGREGGRNDTDGLSSVEFIGSGGDLAQGFLIEVWERDYS